MCVCVNKYIYICIYIYSIEWIPYVVSICFPGYHHIGFMTNSKFRQSYEQLNLAVVTT